MNAGQLAAGIDAEFLGQHAPAVGEDPQRLGVPPAAVQRDHQQPAHPLAQRMVRHQGGQVGHDLLVAAQREQDVGPFLGGGRAQLGQPHPLGLRERAGHPGERDAAPQPERGLQRVDRAGRVAALAQLPGPGQVLLEGDGVGLAGHQVQHVPGPGGDQHAARPAHRPGRLDDAAKAGHVGVDAALGAGGRILPPDRVDELAAGDHPVGAHGEDAEHGLLPGLAHAQLLVAVPRRYRAEHADAQHHGFADLPSPHLLPPPPTRAEASSSRLPGFGPLIQKKSRSPRDFRLIVDPRQACAAVGIPGIGAPGSRRAGCSATRGRS